MKLQGELAEFLSSPVLLMVSAADEQGRPAIGRAMGLDVRGPNEIEMMLSRWQWPDVVRNIVSSGRLALTASRAADYVTYQLKGSATIRESNDEAVERARLYWAAITEDLGKQQVPAYLVAQWAPDRDMVAVRLSVAELYVQTPGPLAGTSV